MSERYIEHSSNNTDQVTASRLEVLRRFKETYNLATEKCFQLGICLDNRQKKMLAEYKDLLGELENSINNASTNMYENVHEYMHDKGERIRRLVMLEMEIQMFLDEKSIN